MHYFSIVNNRIKKIEFDQKHDLKDALLGHVFGRNHEHAPVSHEITCTVKSITLIFLRVGEVVN